MGVQVAKAASGARRGHTVYLGGCCLSAEEKTKGKAATFREGAPGPIEDHVELLGGNLALAACEMEGMVFISGCWLGYLANLEVDLVLLKDREMAL